MCVCTYVYVCVECVYVTFIFPCLANFWFPIFYYVTRLLIFFFRWHPYVYIFIWGHFSHNCLHSVKYFYFRVYMSSCLVKTCRYVDYCIEVLCISVLTTVVFLFIYLVVNITLWSHGIILLLVWPEYDKLTCLNWSTIVRL